MKKINSKLPNVGSSIFSVMAKMSNEYDAINLSQGFPNFPIDDLLRKEAALTVQGEYHQYLPMPGYAPLMQEVAQKIEVHYKRSINTEEELLITAGATQGIFTAIQAVINKGDEVIVLDPSYDCYDPAIQLAGGIVNHVNLNSDFSVDWNKVEEAISLKTRMLIINNPHNPGGKVLNNNDVEALELLMDRNPQLFLLSDEVYEFIYFEKKHISINTREKIIDRSIIVSSFGKSFHVTGWKTGYVVAPPYLMKEIKKIHQYVVFCVNSVAQISLANYLPKVDLSQLGTFYKEKRDLFQQLLKESRFELLDCQGSYFQVARYTEISNINDVDFSIEMTKKYGVAVIPISVFNKDKHDDHLIRFCFAKDNDTLIKAAEKLCKI